MMEAAAEGSGGELTNGPSNVRGASSPLPVTREAAINQIRGNPTTTRPPRVKGSRPQQQTRASPLPASALSKTWRRAMLAQVIVDITARRVCRWDFSSGRRGRHS